MGPRIFGMGMEMSQQGGGIGTRGAGETNTEKMKRHLAEQEKKIRGELERVSRSRAVHRAHRRRVGLKTVSIVGYTNAGKSSLLNALTHKGAYVANALFATLDTRVGKLWLPEQNTSILLSDTIGFIQDLPPDLISAFRSTLEETIEADILLHVIDVNDEHVHKKIEEVQDVLTQLGITDTPVVYVFNKIDLAKSVPRKTLEKKYKKHTPVFVSSLTGEGMEDLVQKIAEYVGGRAL
jgi:GTP-binding protein HflX